MLKKLISIVILFFFQISSFASTISEADFKKITLSNNINVSFYENFRSPAVVVNVTFHIRKFEEQLNKYAIREIIAANLVDEKIHNKLLQIGAEYKVSVSNFGIEFFARVNSENLKELFLLIYEIASKENINIIQLDAFKSALKIKEKISAIFKLRAVQDNVFSLFDKKWPYDETSLNLTTEYDVIDFMNHIRNCHISIAVCGAVGYKNLLKILQSSVSNLSFREKKTEYKEKITPPKCKIHIENKYTNNSILYFYYLPNINKKDLQIFWAIVQSEIFKFMMKANKSIQTYYINQSSNIDGLYSLVLIPKSDISIERVKELYKAFTNRMCNISLSSERISEIAQQIEVDNNIELSDLDNICALLVEAYNGSIDLLTQINIANEITNISPEKIKSIANSVFNNESVIEVKTQFNLGM